VSQKIWQNVLKIEFALVNNEHQMRQVTY